MFIRARAKLAGWGHATLKLELGASIEVDFAIEIIGFEMAQIDLFPDDRTPARASADPADALPDLAVEAVAWLEGLWLVGSNSREALQASPGPEQLYHLTLKPRWMCSSKTGHRTLQKMTSRVPTESAQLHTVTRWLLFGLPRDRIRQAVQLVRSATVVAEPKVNGSSRRCTSL